MTYDIGIFIDGLSLPPKEGIAVHTQQLAVSLVKDFNLKVAVITADRNRATLSDLRTQPYDTFLVSQDTYYNRQKITTLIKQHKIQCVQNYNSYYVVTVLGPAAQAANVPLVVEHHDYEGSLDFLNDDTAETNFNIAQQRQATTISSLARVMSKYDYEQMCVAFPEAQHKMTWLPVAVSDRGINRQPAHGKTALFIGNCGYPPNREAAEEIIHKIAPHVPDWTFLLVGRGTKSLATRSSNVRCLGEVNDLNPFIQQSTVGLSPLKVGSGMKVKLLTYLSSGLPILASPISMHGYPHTDAFSICESSQDYAQTLRHLAADKSLWQRKVKAAQKTHDTYFSITTVNAAYVQQLRNLQPVEGCESTPAIDLSRLHWLQEVQNQQHFHRKRTTFIQGTTV